MTSKQLNIALKEETGISERNLNKLSEALGIIIGESIAAGKQIMLPRIGTFDIIIEDEHIQTDPATGLRTLYPPKSTVNYTPAASLLSTIKTSPKNEQQ